MSTLEQRRNSVEHSNCVHSLTVSRNPKRTNCVCCQKVVSLMCSNVGLFALIAGYTYLGAIIFRHLEAPHENGITEHVIAMRNMTIVRLWNITDKFNVIYKKNWTLMVTDEIMNFQLQFMQAVREGYDGRDAVIGQAQKWFISNAFLYSLTVITTIGYGNIAPKTNEGKVATVIYAIIGIPIMVLFLVNSGCFLANCVRNIYRQCFGNSRNGNKKCKNAYVNCSSYVSPAASLQTHHVQHHIHDNYHIHDIGLNEVGQNQSLNAGHYINPNKHYCGVGDHQNCNQFWTTLTNTDAIVDVDRKLCSPGCLAGGHECIGTLTRDGYLHSTPQDTFRHNDHSNHQSIENSAPPEENQQQSQSTRRAMVFPVIICLLLISGYICFGATLLYRFEGWPLLDGLYFCFITLSTIGFAGFGSDSSTLFAHTAKYERKLIIFACYVLIGMVLISTCFSLVHDKIVVCVRHCKHNCIAKDEDGYGEEDAATDLQQTAQLEHNDHFDT